MKELLLPWNNWHSFSSPASYLTQSSPALARWKVSADQHLKSLRGAEDLETSMLAAITQFNTRRLNRSVARDDSTGNIAVDAAGRSKVKEGPRLLRPLFVTTEYNLASARQKSGLHPSVQGTGPVQAVQIPTTFFLNASVLAGGGPAQHVGLGVAKAREFGSFSITAPEYAAAVRAAGLRLSGLQGDADFAWLVPEPSHIDTDMVDRLIRRGVISPQFVAAVSSVDLESPVFSEERASLLRFVPNEFDFAPAAGAHPDDLTTKVLAAVAASNPAAGSAEARFAEALRSSDPLKLLADRVAAYHSRVAAALNGPNTRRVEIERLFSRLAAVRRAALEDETLRHLNETGDRLLPIP